MVLGAAVGALVLEALRVRGALEQLAAKLDDLPDYDTQLSAFGKLLTSLRDELTELRGAASSPTQVLERLEKLVGEVDLLRAQVSNIPGAPTKVRRY